MYNSAALSLIGDDQEEILVSITASELKKAGIDSSDMTVTFYGYDFAWYDGGKFIGVVKRFETASAVPDDF